MVTRVCQRCGGPSSCACQARDVRDLVLVVVLALALCGLLVRNAHGQDSRPEHVVAASVCWLEASFSETDCAALLHALLRRAERSDTSFVDMAYRYSALRRTHERAVLARQLPDGDEPTWNTAVNRSWAKLRLLAKGVLEGTVADPCPRSTQWGGMKLKHDVRRAQAAVAAGRWVEAKCAGQTANTFFLEVRSSPQR